MQSFMISKLDFCIVPRFFPRQNDIVAETKCAEKHTNKNLLFIQNMTHVYAIAPTQLWPNIVNEVASYHDLGPSSYPRRVSGAEPNPGSNPNLGPSSHPRRVSGAEPNPGSNPDLGPSSHPRRVSGAEPNPGSKTNPPKPIASRIPKAILITWIFYDSKAKEIFMVIQEI